MSPRVVKINQEKGRKRGAKMTKKANVSRASAKQNFLKRCTAQKSWGGWVMYASRGTTEGGAATPLTDGIPPGGDAKQLAQHEGVVEPISRLFPGINKSERPGGKGGWLLKD